MTTHSGTRRTEPFRVVSQNSFPQYGGFVSLGTGVLLTTRPVSNEPPASPVPRSRGATGVSGMSPRATSA